MHLKGERLPLQPEGRRSNPWRMLIYVILIASGILLTRMVEAGRVKPLLSPTPIPTRTSLSYSEEGKAYFSAGDLDKAISAYESAVNADPQNGQLWAELARIQTYSSELRTNYEDRRIRLDEAMTSADRAVAVSPDNSFAHAIRALVYDWAATAQEELSERERFFNEAEIAAVRANELDKENPLALAYYAEVLTDQQKWAQALDVVEQAVSMAEASSEKLGDLQMDIYRVYGTVLESLGLYRSAIEAYVKASTITPNLTFLYLNIGVNYRQLRDYDTALDYFNQAVQINKQLHDELQDQDPVPYLAIGKTYSQQGEFFAAALNIARALAINPSDADIYGRLGIVYYKARNYESAIPVLKCAVEGCTAQESNTILCDLGYAECEPESDAPLAGMDVRGLVLGSGSVEYYYTYAAALAYYSGTEEYPLGCQDAEGLHEQLLGLYGADPIVYGIVEENRAICSQVSDFVEEATPESSPVSPTPTLQP